MILVLSTPVRIDPKSNLPFARNIELGVNKKKKMREVTSK